MGHASMDVYSNLTVAQLRAKLVEYGHKMPTNTRKQGLVDRLIELETNDAAQDDHLSNNNSVEKCSNDCSPMHENDDSSDELSHYGYSSDHPDQDLSTTDGSIDSFTQAQTVEHENAKKVWILETREKEGTFNEPEIKFVGVYSNGRMPSRTPRCTSVGWSCTKYCTPKNKTSGMKMLPKWGVMVVSSVSLTGRMGKEMAKNLELRYED